MEKLKEDCIITDERLEYMKVYIRKICGKQRNTRHPKRFGN